MVCVGPGRKPDCWFSHVAAHINALVGTGPPVTGLTNFSQPSVFNTSLMGTSVFALENDINVMVLNTYFPCRDWTTCDRSN